MEGVLGEGWGEEEGPRRKGVGRAVGDSPFFEIKRYMRNLEGELQTLGDFSPKSCLT